MKKILAITVTMFFLMSMFVGCNSDSMNTKKVEQPKGAQNSKKLTISMDLPPSDTWVKAAKKFGELVKQKTNGSIEVQVYDSASLGTQREALEGMLVGTVDGTVSLEPVSYWVKDIGLFGVPYLFKDENHIKSFMDGQLGKEINDKMIKSGFRPITYFVRAPRQISSSVPINSLNDLKGIKIRVPETPTAPAAFEAMGAKAVTMPFSEVYSALQQKVITAQENPLTLIVANKFHEVQKYIALTNHQYQAAYFLLSEKTYRGLTDEQRKAIDEAAKETQAYESNLLKADLENSIKILEKAGVTITKPDTTEFAKAAEKAYSGYDPLMQDWIKKIKAMK